MIARIRKVLAREEGASAVEYGLLIAGIAMVVIAAVFFLGGAIRGNFDKVGSSVSNAGG